MPGACCDRWVTRDVRSPHGVNRGAHRASMVGNRMTSTYGYSNGYGEKARFNLGLPLSSIQLGAS